MAQAPSGNFVWGNIALSFVQTKRYEITPVTDPSGLDVIAAKHTISVSGLLTSGLAPSRPGESASAILARLKHEAIRHRRYLCYAPFGEPVLEVGDKLAPTDPEKNSDVMGGPKCTRFETSLVTEMCISVDMTVEAVIVPCTSESSEANAPRAILSSRWEESETFDQLGYCTRTLRGTMMLRHGHGKTTDEILEEAKLPRVRIGYQEMDGSQYTLSPDGLTFTWTRTEKEFEAGPHLQAKRAKVHATLTSKPGVSMMTLSIEMDAPAARTGKAGNLLPDNRWVAMIARLRDIVQFHRRRYTDPKAKNLPPLQSQSLTADEFSYSLRYTCSFLASPLTWMQPKDGLPNDETLDQFAPFCRLPDERIDHRPARVNASASGYTFTSPKPQEPCGPLVTISATFDGELVNDATNTPGVNSPVGVDPANGVLTGDDWAGGDWGPVEPTPGTGGPLPPINKEDYQPGGKYGFDGYQLPEVIGPVQVVPVTGRDGKVSEVMIPARDASVVYGLAPASSLAVYGPSPEVTAGGANGDGTFAIGAIFTDTQNDGVGVEPSEPEPEDDPIDDETRYTHYIIEWDHIETTGRHVTPTSNHVTRAGHVYDSNSGQVKLVCRWVCERAGVVPQIPDWEPPQQSLADQPSEKVIVDRGGVPRTYKLTQHKSNYVLTKKRITTESKKYGASGELIHVISGQYEYDVIDPDRAILMHGYRPDILKEVKSAMSQSQGLVPDHYPRAADVIWWGLSSGPGQHEFRLRTPPQSTPTPAEVTSQSQLV